MARRQPPLDRPTIFAAALIVAIGGLIYELLLGTTSSYLFGDSVTSFSVSIGTTLFGMGLGSLAASRLSQNAPLNFVRNEIALSLLGGNSVLLLFAAFSYTKLYWLVFIVLSVAIGFAIGLEIPLMLKMARQHSSDKNVALLSKILALDYIGALVASLLFPFLLLPYLGLVRTAYAVAVLNILTAWFILTRLQVTQRVSAALRTSVLISAGLLGCGLLYATSLEKAISTSMYRDPVVHFAFTQYQKIALTQYRDDTRLYLNDQLQFSSLDEARYHETLAHASLSSTKHHGKVLILGGGDGLLAREVLKYPGVMSVTIVDIDPAVTAMARDHRLLKELNRNALLDSRVKVINADAHTYVSESPDQYDVILADLIDPSNERVSKLYSLEFYRRAASIMRPNGVFATQATSTYFTPRAFGSIHKTMQAGFDDRQVVPLSVNVPSFGEWGFIMATSEDAKLFREHQLPGSLQHIRTDLLDSAHDASVSVLAKQPTDLPVTTLLTPKIYTIYQEDMRQWRY